MNIICVISIYVSDMANKRGTVLDVENVLFWKRFTKHF